MEIDIDIGGPQPLLGDLVVPEGASGLVVFAHGSGSSRLSPRNRRVAEALNERGLGTLLFDLLTVDEDRDRAHRFDIDRLTRRLLAAIDDVGDRHPTSKVGVFGASTGAAGALVAAAARPDRVATVVSRGGRPDLAGDVLGSVQVPSLLIVGGEDRQVLELNRMALDALPDGSALEVVRGATHLFEEPGAMDEVVRLAGDWFVRFLS